MHINTLQVTLHNGTKNEKLSIGGNADTAKSQRQIASAKSNFLRTLGKTKKKIYCSLVGESGSAILPSKDRDFEKDVFPISVLKVMIFQRVLELGWSKKYFEEFDRNAVRAGRDSHKPERIGKKYQWIAHHECMAKLSDNFGMMEDKQYCGPWQLYIRDIDPSWIVPSTKQQQWKSHSQTWWFPYHYGHWRKEKDNTVWLQDNKDLPAFSQLIKVRQQNGTSWLALEALYKINEPTPPGEDRYEKLSREIWFAIRSYLVRSKDALNIFDWLKKQNFYGNWMPKGIEKYHMFVGEFYESLCFTYYENAGWHSGWSEKTSQQHLPCKSLVTTDQYFWESTSHDCSIDSNINVHLPAKEIVDAMRITQPRSDGSWYDNSGHLVAFDPSIKETGPGAMLIRKDTFEEFLQDNDLEILWIILGAKQLLGGSYSSESDEDKGRMIVNGVYRLLDGAIDGNIEAQFRPYRTS